MLDRRSLIAAGAGLAAMRPGDAAAAALPGMHAVLGTAEEFLPLRHEPLKLEMDVRLDPALRVMLSRPDVRELVERRACRRARPVRRPAAKKQRDTEPRIPTTRVHAATLRVPALWQDHYSQLTARAWQRMGAGT